MFTDTRNCLIMNKLQNGSMEEIITSRLLIIRKLRNSQRFPRIGVNNLKLQQVLLLLIVCLDNMK